MSLIPDDKKELLRNDFKEKMEGPVKIVMFTQEIECGSCSNTRDLVQELATLNDKISVEVYDFLVDAAKAKWKEQMVEHIPSLSLLSLVALLIQLHMRESSPRRP